MSEEGFKELAAHLKAEKDARNKASEAEAALQRSARKVEIDWGVTWLHQNVEPLTTKLSTEIAPQEVKVAIKQQYQGNGIDSVSLAVQLYGEVRNDGYAMRRSEPVTFEVKKGRQLVIYKDPVTRNLAVGKPAPEGAEAKKIIVKALQDMLRNYFESNGQALPI